jgi:long-chain acyl-CoA synthetase
MTHRCSDGQPAHSGASDLQESNMSLASLLRDAASRVPNKPALYMKDRVLTYAELDGQAQRLARRLIACGTKPGDRVALHMQNGAEIAIAYFACFLAGAIAVPINARLKGPEIEYLLEHSGSSIYVGQREVALEEINSRLPCVRPILLDQLKLEVRFNVLSAVTLPLAREDDPAVILYTSGSTASPKGVVHSHRSLLNAARGLWIESDDVIMIVMSMAHSVALAMLLAGTAAGAAAVVVRQFEADPVLDAIACYGATYMIGIPIMYRALTAAQAVQPRDITSMRLWLASGDTVPSALQSNFSRHVGLPLHEVFGATETGVIAANWGCGAKQIGSFGRAAPGVEVVVIDANRDLVSFGTEGEMIVRSPANMIGYWNDPSATAGALINGWFHTGDLVSQDPSGYLSFRGRKKEIIVRGGANVSPQEVEAIFYQHGGVREAGVVGGIDPIWGERVVAFVSRRPSWPVTAEELIAFVEKRLAAYKVPEEVVFLEDLPKNATGKVNRRALRERYAAADRPVEQA